MANKKYGLNGIAQDVEFGKQGLIVKTSNGYYELMLADGTTLAKVKIADGVGSGDAVNKGQLDLKLDITKVVTDINAVAGNVADAPTVLTAIQNQIAALVDSSPIALDTLNELAAALGDDPNFATTVTNLISGNTAKIGNLETLSGVPTGSTDLGTFTEGIIPENSTTKEALQELETGFKNLSTTSILICGHADFTKDTTTVDLGSIIPTDKHIKRVYVKVTEAFDTAATLSIGIDGGDVDAITATDKTDLQSLGVYEDIPLIDTTANTQMVVTITANSATVGAGKVYVEVC